uniref:Uncharacterized protein n=1 Tax=Romanomermis culicivorax TaxID=13658 RepID=A0A915JJW0_ROMCU
MNKYLVRLSNVGTGVKDRMKHKRKEIDRNKTKALDVGEIFPILKQEVADFKLRICKIDVNK